MKRWRGGFHKPTEGPPWGPWKDIQRGKEVSFFQLCINIEILPLKTAAVQIQHGTVADSSLPTVRPHKYERVKGVFCLFSL